MRGPLHGIKVIDLSAVVSGPLATTILGDQGADVITVEQVGRPDSMRSAGPMHEGISAGWAVLNRNKRAIALSLDDERGRQVLDDLIADADVLVQNFRPGAIDRMGFGYPEMSARHRDLIYVSITGFGPTGPYSDRRVYDPIVQAVAGFCDVQTDPVTGPSLVRTIAVDKITAVYVAQAVTAALFARERGAGGQHIEISMLDTAVGWLWPESLYNFTYADSEIRYPEFASNYRVSRAADGYFCSISIQDKEFRSLCHVIGRDDLAVDPRFVGLMDRVMHASELVPLIEAEYVKHPVDDLVARLVAAEVPAARVNSRAELLSDPQVTHSGTIEEHVHPNGMTIRQPRPAARFSMTPSAIGRPAPGYGQHSHEVLIGLGRTDGEITAMRNDGVIA
jgi:crotonobetainyl-CoA:carnitine CoA-transferase CaiB-like acyl-CoA transferase